MPNTLIPIQTYTLSSSATSVTFSNIPQNYTDLKVVFSTRDDNGQSQNGIFVSINGSTANFTNKYLSGSGSAASSGSIARFLGYSSGAGATATTFSNGELYFPNYTSASNKSFSSDNVQETNATAAYSVMSAHLWSQTAAITSISLSADSANFVANSTFTLYGISNGVKAVGGTLTVAGGYAYHTFTSTGSFLPSQQIKGAEILSVAGGGGGGGNKGGGGGAGGLRYLNSQTLNAGNSYTALVGSGGAGSAATNGPGGNGSNSVFLSLTSTGGGGGGGGDAGGGTNINGRDGGSGGGSANNGAGTSVAGVGVVGQGNNGGNVDSATLQPGGGGGAGSVGFNGVEGLTQSYGGVGSLSYSSWGSVTGTGELVGGIYYYAGGGGGGSGGLSRRPLGGSGGGGTGGSRNESPTFIDNATAGTANTGGGGGGGSTGASAKAGKAGGSGLVIVRYRLD